MRFIPTRIHGMLDYLTGILLIAAPWLFNFADGGAKQWLPVIVGAGVLLYSLLTDYELGAAHVIPMPVHLMLDFGGGALLAASPWIFGFADEMKWPHVAIGLFEIAAALMTHLRPDYEHEERFDRGTPSAA